MTAQEARELMPKNNTVIDDINASIKIMAEGGKRFYAFSIAPDFIPELKKYYEENGFTVKLSDVSPNYFEVNW